MLKILPSPEYFPAQYNRVPVLFRSWSSSSKEKKIKWKRKFGTQPVILVSPVCCWATEGLWQVNELTRLCPRFLLGLIEYFIMALQSKSGGWHLTWLANPIGRDNQPLVKHPGFCGARARRHCRADVYVFFVSLLEIFLLFPLSSWLLRTGSLKPSK